MFLFLFYWEEVQGCCGIDTGRVKQISFSDKRNHKAVHSSLLWINKPSSRTQLCSASSFNSWCCRICRRISPQVILLPFQRRPFGGGNLAVQQRPGIKGCIHVYTRDRPSREKFLYIQQKSDLINADKSNQTENSEALMWSLAGMKQLLGKQERITWKQITWVHGVHANTPQCIFGALCSALQGAIITGGLKASITFLGSRQTFLLEAFSSQRQSSSPCSRATVQSKELLSASCYHNTRRR